MDMTSLSSTLPGGNPNASRSSKSQKQTSPEANSQPDDAQALMEAFQSAARSVTHLYRSSASLVRSSRQEGYAEALSDVLESIDNESAYNDPALALSRIRDWVIDRRHDVRGSGNVAGGRGGSLPPRQQREMSAESDMEESNLVKEEERREEPRQTTGYTEASQSHPPQSSQPLAFTFQPPSSLPQYPVSGPDLVQPLPSPEIGGMFTFNAPVSPIQPQFRPNANKGPLTPRNGNASALGGGAGTKRRNQQVDFFDLGGFGNFNFNGGNNNGGGNGGYGPGNAKRGKFV